MTDVTINEPKISIFKPEPDITAYELAVLLPYLIGAPITLSAYEELGSAARHLK